MKSETTLPVVFITGSIRRIGLSIATAFAQNGWRVALHSRKAENSPEATEALAQLPPPRLGTHCFFSGDLRLTETRNVLVSRVIATMGRLDCLINNASVYQRSPMAELTLAAIQGCYDINCWAPLALMQAYHASSLPGCIINLLDQRMDKIEPASGAYCLAKKTLRDITLACALEWAPTLRVNGIAPGIVLPPPGIASMDGLKRMGALSPLKASTTPEEIAASCLFLATATGLTGQIIYADGGLHLTQADLGEPKVQRNYNDSQN